MDELVSCYKCQQIPFDILMMNCNHNLCVKCASERFNRQKQSKIQGHIFIQCQNCKVKTILDEESEMQMKKLGQNSSKNQILSDNVSKRAQTPLNKNRTVNKNPSQFLTHKNKISSSLNNEECSTHPQEPVIYFCFTCKCRCFCAQCILTGSHQDHDVKTIRKAYLSIKDQFTEIIEKTKKFVKNLYVHKKQIGDEINSNKNKVENMKKIVQKAFNQVRDLIRQKEKKVIGLLEGKFQKVLQTNNGTFKKQIESQIVENQQFSKKLQNISKKGEITILNSYSVEWDSFKKQINNQKISSPEESIKFDLSLADHIKKIKEQINQLEFDGM